MQSIWAVLQALEHDQRAALPGMLPYECLPIYLCVLGTCRSLYAYGTTYDLQMCPTPILISASMLQRQHWLALLCREKRCAAVTSTEEALASLSWILPLSPHPGEQPLLCSSVLGAFLVIGGQRSCALGPLPS